jgi:hypothetical protein
MDIKQQWQDALHEFGDRAFERFIICLPDYYEHYLNSIGTWFYFKSNQDLISCPDFNDIELKSMPELFEHDVSVYGDNAYLMWSCSIDRFIIDNDSVKDLLPGGFLNLTRKSSAALPFQVERA